MKIWMPCSPHQVAQFVKSGTLSCPSGFAITPEWTAAVDDDDEEFLEDEMLFQAGQGQTVVLVAEMNASVQDAKAGVVTLAEDLTMRTVRAFFAKSDADEEEFSWFGPTEGANLLEFLGISD